MTESVSVWYDDRPVKNLHTCVSVFDRGLQYGDGFFTTAKIENGFLLNWTEHKSRLQKSASRLGFPEIDFDALQRNLKNQFLQFSPLSQTEAVCKILVTRGEGGRGYLPPEGPNMQVFSFLMPLPTFSPEAIQAELSPIIMEVSPELAGVKHLNRLTNVMARQALSPDCDEAIVLNAFGQVQCGTQSNLFIVQENQIFTPQISLSGVEGTVRNLLIKSAGVQQKILHLADIYQAEALFFTNAIRGVQIVKSLDLSNGLNLQTRFDELGISVLKTIPETFSKTFSKTLSKTLPAGKKAYMTDLPTLSELQNIFDTTAKTNALALQDL